MDWCRKGAGKLKDWAMQANRTLLGPGFESEPHHLPGPAEVIEHAARQVVCLCLNRCI